MSDLADTTTGRPAADAGLPLTGDTQKTGEGEGTTNRGASQHLKRVMSPLGWVGVVLFVVGVIVIGIAIGNTQNIGAVEDTAVRGHLGPVSSIAAFEEIGTHAVIGKAVVNETVAAFTDPQGNTLARVSTGEYGLLDSRPGWARLVLSGPDSNGLFVTGWVEVNQSMTVLTS